MKKTTIEDLERYYLLYIQHSNDPSHADVEMLDEDDFLERVQSMKQGETFSVRLTDAYGA